MPGDTKIKRVFHQGATGWVDVDAPATIYPARRVARDARRNRLNGRLSFSPPSAQRMPTFTATTVQPASPTPLSGLQNRLLDRLTTFQGVTTDEAMDVITAHGYNASASYGHMRFAGATHHEALIVIGLDSPDVSLAYGMARARGVDHADSLREALRGYSDLNV